MAYDFDMSGIPPKLREILEDLAGRIPEASEPTEIPQADAVAPVSAADASTAISAEYTQAEVQAIAALTNANTVAINALIANLKAAGLMKGD